MNPWLKLLAALQGLSLIHRVGHWTSNGPNSYSDHLLFERLYDSVEGEVDKVAEKALGLPLEMGLGSLELDPLALCKVTSSFLRLIPSPAVGVVEALKAERAFLTVLAESMSEIAALTALDPIKGKGVDNLLAGIMDKHEEHVYLLQQRVQ